MNFPLPVRSVSSVDYFTPLHVDTNIEYSLDMGKFPEINDPLHHWEPALVVASQSDLTDPLETRSVLSTSSEQDQSQLDDLIDTYDIGDSQMDDMDFGLADLPASSLQSLLDSADSFFENSLSPSVELNDPVLSRANHGHEDVYFPEGSVEHFHRPIRQTKRKLEDGLSSNYVERQTYKERRLDVDYQTQCVTEYQTQCVTEYQTQCVTEYQTQCVTEYQTQCVTEYQTQCVTEYQIPLSERHSFLDFRHTSPTDTGLRQW